MEQQNIDQQIAKHPEIKERPAAITIVCILGFIGAAFTIPLFFLKITREVGSWYPPYLGLSSVIGLICLIGLWKMKKWAAYAYAALAGVNQIVLLTTRTWNIMALIIPAIIAGIALANLKRMD